MDKQRFCLACREVMPYEIIGDTISEGYKVVVFKCFCCGETETKTTPISEVQESEENDFYDDVTGIIW